LVFLHSLPMVGSVHTVGVVVRHSSDPDGVATIACKDNSFDVSSDLVPPGVELGTWLACRFNNGAVGELTETKRKPLDTRVEDGNVQILSYVAVPFGHCSMRDDYLLPRDSQVWSPHLGFASSEQERMFGLREEILYEAWLEYKDVISMSDRIWKLARVGRPLVDPEHTILLKQTPWKKYTKKEEETDTSMTAKLNRTRLDCGYQSGMVIAMIYDPEPGVVLLKGSEFISTRAKNIEKSIYQRLAVGKIVRFKMELDNMDREYPDIVEILVTTKKDIRFEVNDIFLKRSKELSTSEIKLLTTISIDDDLISEEGDSPINIITQYGPVLIERNEFANRMEAVCLEFDDLVEARKSGQELRVWIHYLSIYGKWRISSIDEEWFTRNQQSD
ncbi:hypothetical protein PFISCL1PPCAC_20089, partial [Pristionchus fissidentatus]